MVDCYFYKEKKSFVIHFYGPVLSEDITRVGIDLDIAMTQIECFQLYVDLTNARVVDCYQVTRMAKSTRLNYKNFERMFIYGMSPFMKVLYKDYLKKTNLDSLHEIGKESFIDCCANNEFYVPSTEHSSADSIMFNNIQS